MSKRVVIVGAGINGLVAANYLARAGFDVTVLERKDHPGGACTAGKVIIEGVECEYPQGASVFGFMEQFVFEETGLKDVVSIHCPEHPEIVYLGEGNPVYMYKDPSRLVTELAARWGEKGDIKGFLDELERVVVFLRGGYKDAVVPTLASAEEALGEELTARWIVGSAKALLDRFFTSDAMKVYFGLSVIESGPVSYGSPYSALSIPLMYSGSIFDGDWGYVKGGIWQIPLELQKFNDALGVKTIFLAQVEKYADGKIAYEHGGTRHEFEADYVLFATDPVTAAEIAGETPILEKLGKEKMTGTSGKLILFFKDAPRWKDDRGEKHFASAFRYIIPPHDLAESERLSGEVAEDTIDFAPGLFEIYCEGAGDRELGGNRLYELVSIFFKNLSFDKRGIELPEVKEEVVKLILSKVENPEALAHAILETPRDIKDMFFFPKGNIDDVDLAEGQTFFQRTYSPEPARSFYQFGRDPRAFYCAAGAYPCGSVAGTPGYMCAKQLIEKTKE